MPRPVTPSPSEQRNSRASRTSSAAARVAGSDARGAIEIPPFGCEGSLRVARLWLHRRSGRFQGAAGLVEGAGVKPWYKNMVVLTGLVLLVLGAGNWATGEVRLRQHETLIAAIEHRELAEDADRGNRSAEDEDDEALELARVRMDFYHVVASGGRLLTAAGLVLTALGLARYLRPRGRSMDERSRRVDEPV